jgi:two-component system sensor kinase FixL
MFPSRPTLGLPRHGLPLPWTVLLGYLTVFLLLDWASYIHPFQGLNITPWNPQPALAIALLLASSQLWWVVWVGLVAAEIVVRGLPDDLFVAAAASAVLTLSFLAIARALQQRLRDGPLLATVRDVRAFIAIMLVGSLASGMLYIGTLALGGQGLAAPLHAAIARYWIGDAVGLLVTLPILLAAMDPARRRLLGQTLRNRRAWVISALTLSLTWLVFGLGIEERFQFFDLLLLPVVWASVQFGVVGAVLAAALTQVALIVAVQTVPHPDLTVFQLQMLMAAVTVTGLLLGVLVDERARAEAQLRRSLRLAAAGQMSAALAHELSQPLTALATYAQACQMLLDAARPLDETRRAQLVDIARRIGGDAKRAGEVVKRLRDFFRSGATTLERVDLAGLIREALATHEARAQLQSVALVAELREPLPAPWIDPVQMHVVLRNLIANAIEAAAAAPPPARVRVRVVATTIEATVSVIDSGPGLPEGARPFDEPGASAKAGGMGIGLSICRAIVEAHGGRLWAEPVAAGHFCFTLPLNHAGGEPETEADEH